MPFEWSCSSCTYLHKAPANRCVMCGNLRNASTQEMRAFIEGKTTVNDRSDEQQENQVPPRSANSRVATNAAKVNNPYSKGNNNNNQKVHTSSPSVKTVTGKPAQSVHAFFQPSPNRQPAVGKQNPYASSRNPSPSGSAAPQQLVFRQPNHGATSVQQKTSSNTSRPNNVQQKSTAASGRPSSSGSALPLVPKPNPFQRKAIQAQEYRPGPVPLDAEKIKEWIYPVHSKFPVRSYQLEIAQTSIEYNTLVSLPTGLGKTLIAAVVLYNFYRWFPQGKVIFLAPTLPLVDQQVKACYQIMGIPAQDTAVLNGKVNAATRQKLWNERRVFFCTPQTVEKDMEAARCPASHVVCLVLDEAHKATGNFAYTKVVELCEAAGAQLRILGLSATPGAKVQQVQKVIDALRITRLEARSEEEVKEYIHERHNEIIVVKKRSQCHLIEQQMSALIEPIMTKLRANTNIRQRIGPSDATLTSFCIHRGRQHHHETTNGDRRYDGYFAAAQKLIDARANLYSHGIGSVRGKLLELQNNPQRGILSTVVRSPEFVAVMEAVINASSGKYSQETAEDKKLNNPKLAKLDEILQEHFHRADASGKTTRAIVFSQWRESVGEIVDVLSLSRPVIRPRHFVGQSSGSQSKKKGGSLASMKGMPQKIQQQAIREFQEGVFNVLVCTCIGEEGLDIGEVDLIVNYDTLRSPIRMIQRVGRTGRKRDGRVVCLVSEGQEQKDMQKSKNNERSLQRALRRPDNFKLRPNQLMFPDPPKLAKTNVEVKESLRLSQVGGHAVPEQSKKLAADRPADDKDWQLTAKMETVRLLTFGPIQGVKSSTTKFPTTLRRKLLRCRDRSFAATNDSTRYAQKVRAGASRRLLLTVEAISEDKMRQTSKARGNDRESVGLFPVEDSKCPNKNSVVRVDWSEKPVAVPPLKRDAEIAIPTRTAAVPQSESDRSHQRRTVDQPNVKNPYARAQAVSRGPTPANKNVRRRNVPIPANAPEAPRDMVAEAATEFKLPTPPASSSESEEEDDEEDAPEPECKTTANPDTAMVAPAVSIRLPTPPPSSSESEDSEDEEDLVETRNSAKEPKTIATASIAPKSGVATGLQKESITVSNILAEVCSDEGSHPEISGGVCFQLPTQDSSSDEESDSDGEEHQEPPTVLETANFKPPVSPMVEEPDDSISRVPPIAAVKQTTSQLSDTEIIDSVERDLDVEHERLCPPASHGNPEVVTKPYAERPMTSLRLPLTSDGLRESPIESELVKKNEASGSVQRAGVETSQLTANSAIMKMSGNEFCYSDEESPELFRSKARTISRQNVIMTQEDIDYTPDRLYASNESAPLKESIASSLSQTPAPSKATRSLSSDLAFPTNYEALMDTPSKTGTQQHQHRSTENGGTRLAGESCQTPAPSNTTRHSSAECFVDLLDTPSVNESQTLPSQETPAPRKSVHAGSTDDDVLVDTPSENGSQEHQLRSTNGGLASESCQTPAPSKATRHSSAERCIDLFDTPSVHESQTLSDQETPAPTKPIHAGSTDDDILLDTPSDNGSQQHRHCATNSGRRLTDESRSVVDLVDTPDEDSKHSSSRFNETQDDSADDIVCLVCQCGDSTNHDPIVLCDGVNGLECPLAVHTSCYSLDSSVISVMEEWRCDLCDAQSKAKSRRVQPSCVVCQRSNRPLRKQSASSSHWVHPYCMTWSEEDVAVVCKRCSFPGASTCAFASCTNAAHPHCVRDAHGSASWLSVIDTQKRSSRIFCPEHRHEDHSRLRCEAQDDEASVPKCFVLPSSRVVQLDASPKRASPSMDPNPAQKKRAKKATKKTTRFSDEHEHGSTDPVERKQDRRQRVRENLAKRHRAMLKSGFIDTEAALDGNEDFEGDALEAIEARRIDEEEELAAMDFINDSSQMDYTQDELDRVDPEEESTLLHRQFDIEDARKRQFATPVFNRRMKRPGSQGSNGWGSSQARGGRSSLDGLGNCHFIRSVIEHARQGGDVEDIEAVYNETEAELAQEVDTPPRRLEPIVLDSTPSDDARVEGAPAGLTQAQKAAIEQKRLEALARRKRA